MTAITIESLAEKQSELAALIEKFKTQSMARHITLPAISVELQPGERLAGTLLNEDGTCKHTVIVRTERLDGRRTFVGCQEHAQSIGADVASPEEMALIKANCPDLLTESWYWTNRPLADDASYAWNFYSGGGCYYNYVRDEGVALFVRRL